MKDCPCAVQKYRVLRVAIHRRNEIVFVGQVGVDPIGRVSRGNPGDGAIALQDSFDADAVSCADARSTVPMAPTKEKSLFIEIVLSESIWTNIQVPRRCHFMPLSIRHDKFHTTLTRSLSIKTQKARTSCPGFHSGLESLSHYRSLGSPDASR